MFGDTFKIHYSIICLSAIMLIGLYLLKHTLHYIFLINFLIFMVHQLSQKKVHFNNSLKEHTAMEHRPVLDSFKDLHNFVVKLLIYSY